MTVKTAISVPDEIFRQVEEAAAEQGMSRSALFVAAMEKYLFDLETERLRRYLDELPDEVFALTDEDKEWLEWSLKEGMKRLDEEDGGYADPNADA